ncbi:MAG: DNA/RNA non-specific endonuclease [Pseudomonadota bacterium]
MAINSAEYDQLCDIAERRHLAVAHDIQTAWNYFRSGEPLSAENQTTRIAAAQKRRATLLGSSAPAAGFAGAEALKGPRDNFLPVSFLATGTEVSRAVVRIHVRATGSTGTGFMCGPRTLITNKHVLLSPAGAESAVVEFDFVDDDGVQPTTFQLDPAACYVSDEVLARDYALVALGPRIGGPKPLAEFGWCPLSDASDKHSIGEFANIIQHPEGEAKQVVLQDNLITARSDYVLHYVADTQPGSSGAPVFNNAWQVIGLHHWGRRRDPASDILSPAHALDPQSVNQGVRISQIVEHLRTHLPGLDGAKAEIVKEVLDLGEAVSPGDAMAAQSRASPIVTEPVQEFEQTTPARVVSDPQGATWTIPIEISVRIPVLSNDAQSSLDTMTGRPAAAAEAGLPKTGEGYRPDFLDENTVPLPSVKDSHAHLIQPLSDPSLHPSAKPGELQFRHFSVIMNQEREMPLFGACNVDGASLFGINEDGVAYDYAASDVGIFRADAAEGGPGWRNDDRIPDARQTGRNWYTGKNKLVPRPGSDDAARFIATADFDRGHMVRRTEPIWGTRRAGQEANFQTFTYVNAAPQTPAFNRDQKRLPGEVSDGEETRSWYAMEVAVLRMATNEDRKFNVFTGPIFDEDDPVYGPGREGGGDRKVPLAFWKVAVWEDGEDLRALAMSYSQAWSLTPRGAESLAAPGELFMLRDFLSTVKTIEKATGLDFGRDVRRADILKKAVPDDLETLTLEDFQDQFL